MLFPHKKIHHDQLSNQKVVVLLCGLSEREKEEREREEGREKRERRRERERKRE